MVRFSSAVADLDFLRMILEIEEQTNTPIPIDSLIVLSRLRRERRMDIQMLASAIQKDDSAARTVIERLMEIGLVEAHGVKKGRTYTLSAKVYPEKGCRRFMPNWSLSSHTIIKEVRKE